MGLFNFKLGGSKKEQDKPIRDKLKDKKYFEKILSIKFGEIDDDEKHILEEKKKNVGIVRPFLYWCSDDLDRISLGILLDIDNTDFNRLTDYVLRMDKQAKPSNWTPDLLLWFMLNSRLKENKKQTYANKLAFPKLYKELFKLTQISDAQEAKKALKDYMEKWYTLNNDAPWYNSHLKKNCYRGYWAWEVAAVAKIMHIDDSDLRDNPYYPYDMVHWKDAGVTIE